MRKNQAIMHVQLRGSRAAPTILYVGACAQSKYAMCGFVGNPLSLVANVPLPCYYLVSIMSDHWPRLFAGHNAERIYQEFPDIPRKPFGEWNN